MNIQKTFDALKEDMDNSALGLICNEFENQGYQVRVNNNNVTSSEIFDGKFDNLEKLGSITISLLIDNHIDQEFIIEFVEFHDIIIKPKEA